MKPLRKAIFGFDPYVGFDIGSAEPDLQGWGATHELFEKAITRQKPSLIIEVGTWKGASAIHMGRICRSLGLDTEIICVDTWLGAASAMIHSSGGDQQARFASLKMRNGYPMIYYTFMRNVVDAGLQDVITPLAQTSDNGATILKAYNASAELIYIDASHEYKSVLNDLHRYWPLVKSGGTLIGDDFKHKGVNRAVIEFAEAKNLEIRPRGRKYQIMKKRKIAGADDASGVEEAMERDPNI